MEDEGELINDGSRVRDDDTDHEEEDPDEEKYDEEDSEGDDSTEEDSDDEDFEGDDDDDPEIEEMEEDEPAEVWPQDVGFVLLRAEFTLPLPVGPPPVIPLPSKSLTRYSLSRRRRKEQDETSSLSKGGATMEVGGGPSR